MTEMEELKCEIDKLKRRVLLLELPSRLKYASLMELEKIKRRQKNYGKSN